MATYAEQLASVQAAIAALEAGAQSLRLADGAQVQYADLATLYAREERLRPLAEREARGGSSIRIGRGGAL